MIGFFIKGNVIRIWANSTTRLHFPPFAMFESPLISFQYHISSGKQTANKRWSALSQKLKHPSNRLLRNYPIHSRLFHSCIAGSLFPRSSVLFDGDICQLQTSTNKLFKDSNVSISNLQKSGFLFPILRNPVFPSCTNFPISGFALSLHLYQKSLIPAYHIQKSIPVDHFNLAIRWTCLWYIAK